MNEQSEKTKLFIEKARKIHGDKYDYSKVEYTKSREKIIVICKEHGLFEQTANSHIQCIGCPVCGRIKASKTKTFTHDEFIKKANEVHNNLFDYSKVEYINSQTKVIITCKIHGDFEQMPNSHLQGCMCWDCGRIKLIEAQSFTIDEFIKRAHEIHNHKYDYSQVIYTGANNDVIIICKTHGKFNQRPSKHINCKQGCAMCSGKYNFTTEEFINKCLITHGNKYDYSKSQYVNSKTKVLITCKKCGDFEQNPSEHYNAGANCPNCINSNYSKQSIIYLNFIEKLLNIKIQHAENGTEYKILNIGKADGYCKETNTIYEYHGDFWHGNPKKYNSIDINKKNKKTFGEIYQKTLEREQQIRDLGYNLVIMWEHDWNKINKSIRVLQRKFKSLH